MLYIRNASGVPHVEPDVPVIISMIVFFYAHEY